MRCPFCTADDDRVVDSRLAEDGVAIRRRRECAACGQRFTTYERIEEAGLFIVKRSGEREPFDRVKILNGVRAAAKNRPVDDEALAQLVVKVEESMRLLGRDVTSEEVGVATLDALRDVDDVAYVRFASVYKGFEGTDDFAREIGMLVKTTAPKHRN
ncbi:MAG: transcriptional regulator NrdR [Acidobacteriota bacterium]|nr:transcriptional regulator NrdR [Acidobacteriota bacterium]MDE3043320.1 transcriptional regulator NrdR [Acidobacteriota bacterium]MDE3107438.1 transcriptional regulator NrdR [Acidobacteriota bacterium]